MKNVITSLCVIVSVLLVLLLSFTARAATCPINQSFSPTFYDGTAYVPALCLDKCKYIEGFQGSSTWTCTDSFCTGHYVSDGSSCTGDEEDIGQCEPSGNPNGCNPPMEDLPPIGTIPAYTGSNSEYAALFTARNLHFLNNLASNLGKVRLSVANQESVLNHVRYTTNSLWSQRQAGINAINAAADDIAIAASDITSSVDSLTPKLNSIQNTVNATQQAVDELALSGGGGGDMSGVENLLSGLQNMQGQTIGAISSLAGNVNTTTGAVNSLGGTINNMSGNLQGAIWSSNTILGNQVDAVGDAVSGLGGKLDDIADSLSTGDFAPRAPEGQLDFDALPLYNSDALQSVLDETEQLKLDYEQKVQEFRQLFSFDTSGLNQGEYVEHSFNLTLSNGQTISGKSGVFPALIDNAALIAAVLIFLAAVLGARFLF